MMVPAVESPMPDQPWDKAAEGWSRHSSIVTSWLREVTGAMLSAAGIAEGMRVLDVAAGAGGQTIEIARRVGTGGQVLATDISSRILELASANVHAAGVANVKTQVADAQRLDMAGAGFGAAVSRLGLMFCQQPLVALREMGAALQPGGRVAVVVFSGPQANPCVITLMATALRYAGRPAGSPFEPGTLLSLGKPGLLEELLEAAGFSDIQVSPVAAPMRLPSSRHYLDFVRSSGSPIMEILAPLPVDVQNDAWVDMETQLQRFNDADGWCGPNELLLGSGHWRGSAVIS
jgi:ubiquinone/menaquinone biosynthesis C-methylase UbiE